MTSLEQRHQIQALSDQGKSSPEIARQLGLTVRVVRKWVQRQKKGVRPIRLWGGPRGV